MTKSFRSVPKILALLALVVATLAIPTAVSAGNVIYTCGSPGGLACTGGGTGPTTGGTGGTGGVVAPGVGYASTSNTAGQPVIAFQAKCCPVTGINGNGVGFLTARFANGIFVAVISSQNTTITISGSGANDVASMTIKGSGRFMAFKPLSPLNYTFVAADNGSSPDTMTLTLSDGETLSATCKDCVEVTPTS